MPCSVLWPTAARCVCVCLPFERLRLRCFVFQDRQGSIHPLTISHGANAPLEGKSRFRHEFDFTGPPELCVVVLFCFCVVCVCVGAPEGRALWRKARDSARRCHIRAGTGRPIVAGLAARAPGDLGVLGYSERSSRGTADW